jgi:cell division protein FtsN
VKDKSQSRAGRERDSRQREIDRDMELDEREGEIEGEEEDGKSHMSGSTNSTSRVGSLIVYESYAAELDSSCR